MKNLDSKMRERFEQREYYGDRNGLTRLEKMAEKRLLMEEFELKANQRPPDKFDLADRRLIEALKKCGMLEEVKEIK